MNGEVQQFPPVETVHPAGLALVGGARLTVRRDDSSLARAFARRVAPLSADLVDVATSLLAADRCAPRRAGSAWSRRIDVTLPVRVLDAWSRPEVVTSLSDFLGYLTDDEWRLSFVPFISESRASERQDWLFRTSQEAPVRIALLSGGLDSFAGAAIDLSEHTAAEFVLVSGASSTRVGAGQRNQVKALATAGQRPLRHVAFRYALEHACRPAREEKSQRTRGFVYPALGAATALSAGANELHVYENGIGAINLPLDGTHIGARGTRATHPSALARFSRFVEMLADTQFTVRNPFLFSTKGEMCAHPAFQPLASSVGLTFSCDSFPLRLRETTQCGACSSCLLRRLALGAAGLSGVEPAHAYMRTAPSRIGADVPPKRLAAFEVMNRQVALLSVGLRAQDPWFTLTREYPDLFRVALETARESGLVLDDIRAQLLRLYTRHVEEWTRVNRGLEQRQCLARSA